SGTPRSVPASSCSRSTTTGTPSSPRGHARPWRSTARPCTPTVCGPPSPPRATADVRAFIAVPGGWACELEHAELRILARIVADTAELLGSDIRGREDTEPEPAPEPISGDDAVLAALDWD